MKRKLLKIGIVCIGFSVGIVLLLIYYIHGKIHAKLSSEYHEGYHRFTEEEVEEIGSNVQNAEGVYVDFEVESNEDYNEFVYGYDYDYDVQDEEEDFYEAKDDYEVDEDDECMFWNMDNQECREAIIGDSALEYVHSRFNLGNNLGFGLHRYRSEDVTYMGSEGSFQILSHPDGRCEYRYSGYRKHEKDLYTDGSLIFKRENDGVSVRGTIIFHKHKNSYKGNSLHVIFGNKRRNETKDPVRVDNNGYVISGFLKIHMANPQIGYEYRDLSVLDAEEQEVLSKLNLFKFEQ